ncbi:hypothetical protein D5086_011352 [Populus alba]|uniref:Uncharacterized protein n=1 Tax=Populus alba TaxID=43335 RepID=A0ACC4CC63_POPAL
MQTIHSEEMLWPPDNKIAEATKTNNPYKAEATTVPWLGTALSCILRVQGSQAAAAAVGLPSEVLTEGA